MICVLFDYKKLQSNDYVKIGRKEVKTMQTLKTIVADKYFWLGIIVGFAFGVLHHYYAL